MGGDGRQDKDILKRTSLKRYFLCEHNSNNNQEHAVLNLNPENNR